MPSPIDPFRSQFQLRKLEVELGRFCALAESAAAGFRECLSQCLRKSSRSHPLVGQGTGQELVSALAAELRALRPLDAEDEQIVDDLCQRAQSLFEEADRVTRGIFATGALCDHGRNVLYRLKSRRFEECGLSIERLQALAGEAAFVEQQAAVLLFSIRTGRSVADAVRTIHPRTAPAQDASADTGS